MTESVHDEIGGSSAWQLNLKKLFDDYLQESLETIRRNRTFFDKMVTDGQQHDNDRQVTANLALANAVDTANLVNKQAVRHADLAVDRQWGLDEVSALAAGSTTAVAAIAAAIAKAVQEHVASQHS